MWSYNNYILVIHSVPCPFLAYTFHTHNCHSLMHQRISYTLPSVQFAKSSITCTVCCRIHTLCLSLRLQHRLPQHLIPKKGWNFVTNEVSSFGYHLHPFPVYFADINECSINGQWISFLYFNYINVFCLRKNSVEEGQIEEEWSFGKNFLLPCLFFRNYYGLNISLLLGLSRSNYARMQACS